MVQAKLVSRENDSAVIEVTVPLEKVEAALKSVYAQISNSTKIDGFRKGKTPRDILNRMFGLEAIHSQVLQDLIPETYMEAVTQLGITPIDSPEFDPWPTITEGQDLVFNAKIEVLPEFQLPDITSLNLDVEKNIEATEDDIDSTIMDMRKRMASYNEVKRPCAENDRTTLDYVLKVIDLTGKAADVVYDSKDNVPITLGEEELLPDIEDKIKGMAVGEEKDFIVKYPENYQNEDLAGKSVSVHVKVHKIEERVMPEIDEEFLKKVGETGTVEDMRKKLERNILAYKTQVRDGAVREIVSGMVVEQTHLTVPEKLVEQEVEERMEKLRGMFDNDPNAPSFEQALASRGYSEEKLKEEETQNARNTIKKRVVFDEIFSKENMNVSSEEISLAIANYGVRNRLAKTQVKKLLKDREFMINIREELKAAKVVNLLASRVKFKGEWTNTGEVTAADAPAETNETAAEGENKE